MPSFAAPPLAQPAALHQQVFAALLAEKVAHRKARLASSDDHGVVTFGHRRNIALPFPFDQSLPPRAGPNAACKSESRDRHEAVCHGRSLLAGNASTRQHQEADSRSGGGPNGSSTATSVARQSNSFLDGFSGAAEARRSSAIGRQPLLLPRSPPRAGTTAASGVGSALISPPLRTACSASPRS